MLKSLRNLSATIAGWAVGFIVTGLIIWSPFLVFGYRNPSLHLVLDTVDACIALLVAYLVYGRFARQGRIQDLLLAQGLALLAAAGFGLTYAAGSLGGVRTGTLDIWLPLAIRVMGALWIAAAALLGARLVSPQARLRQLLIGLPVAVVAAVFLFLWIARPRLPVALEPSYVPASAQHATLAGHPLLLVAQSVAALCFFIASVAFASQSLRRNDELLRWLGPACALAAFARVNYVLFPSLYTDWLYTGDLLRTGCYFLLLIGAARELRHYWSAQVSAAVLEDRRRLARELHDGVIQELAYIRSEGHGLPSDIPGRGPILHATDRALDEARAAVQALGQPSDEPLGFILHRAARELADRYQVNLEVDLDDSIRASPDQQQALTRITREAVSNAVRHGKARRVALSLSQNGNHRRLVIHDDGEGFDVSSTISKGTGYGLVSMQDRASALPGSFNVEAKPGTGSVVTVRW